MWTEQQRYKRRLHDTVQDIAPQTAQRGSRYRPAGRTAQAEHLNRHAGRTAQADHLSRFVPCSSDGCFFAVPGENSPLRGSNTHQLTAYSRLLPNGLSLSSYDPACCCTACGYVSVTGSCAYGLLRTSQKEEAHCCINSSSSSVYPFPLTLKSFRYEHTRLPDRPQLLLYILFLSVPSMYVPLSLY